MESMEKTGMSEATRALFRSSAQWMRTYAIIMIVVASIMALALLVLSVDGKGLILKGLSQERNNELVQFLIEMLGLILLGIACLVVFLGYAAIKLLGAANRFTALSYSTSPENLTAAFRNLKGYWMFYGITLIIVIVLGTYFMAKMFALVAQAQG